MDDKKPAPQQSAELIPLKTELDKMMEDEFRRRCEENSNGNFGDVARGR